MIIEIGPNLAKAATVVMWTAVAMLPFWPGTGLVAMWIKRGQTSQIKHDPLRK